MNRLGKIWRLNCWRMLRIMPSGGRLLLCANVQVHFFAAFATNMLRSYDDEERSMLEGDSNCTLLSHSTCIMNYDLTQ